jgi:hypothetical protein
MVPYRYKPHVSIRDMLPKKEGREVNGNPILRVWGTAGKLPNGACNKTLDNGQCIQRMPAPLVARETRTVDRTHFENKPHWPILSRTMRYSVPIAAAILATSSTSSAEGTCVQRPDVLRYGIPESVGMLSKPLEDMVANLTHYTEARNWSSHSYNQIVPIEPGKGLSPIS